MYQVQPRGREGSCIKFGHGGGREVVSSSATGEGGKLFQVQPRGREGSCIKFGHGDKEWCIHEPGMKHMVLTTLPSQSCKIFNFEVDRKLIPINPTFPYYFTTLSLSSSPTGTTPRSSDQPRSQGFSLERKMADGKSPGNEVVFGQE